MPKVRIFKKEFEIRSLTAQDFFGEGGLPIQFFQAEITKTMYEQVVASAKPSVEADYKKQVEFMKKILQAGIISCDGEPFDAEKYMQTETNLAECMLVISAILNCSLTLFQGPMRLTRDEAIYWDYQAKRYGKSPIECAFPSGGYSDLDAQMFNSFVMNQGIDFDNAQMKKQADAAKRGRR